MVCQSSVSDPDDILSDLPGAELIKEGLLDQAQGRRTIASCLVEMAAPRLTKAGLLPQGFQTPKEASELHLYRLLQPLENRAYSRYNSLLRLLTSFEHALDHRLSKA
jgi:hypothetical protein